MSAVDDARSEYRALYGKDPDERFETLLSRVWRDGYDEGRRDGIDEGIDYLREIR